MYCHLSPKIAPIIGTGATPSLVRPMKSPVFAVRGTDDWPIRGHKPHRPVKTVSHASAPYVAYYSPPCIHKGPKAIKIKGFSEK